jgi:hypothetical protein
VIGGGVLMPLLVRDGGRVQVSSTPYV